MNDCTERASKIIQVRRGYDAMIEAFLFHCEAKYLSGRTLFCYEHRLKYLTDYAQLIHKPMEELSKEDLLEYFHSLSINRSAKTLKRLSPATINGRIRIFNIFYNFLIKEKVIEENPMQDIHYIREPKNLKPIITPKQLTLALKNFNQRYFPGYRDMCMVLLAYDACLRIDEIISLRESDMQIRPFRQITVRGKGNKERRVSFGANIAVKLLIYKQKRIGIPGDYFFPTMNGRKLDATNVYRSFRKAGDQAGFRMNPHWLRHSGATELYKKCRDLRLVQAVLGHSDIRTTQIYLHVTNHDIVTAYEKISPAMDMTF